MQISIIRKRWQPALSVFLKSINFGIAGWSFHPPPVTMNPETEVVVVLEVMVDVVIVESAMVLTVM